MTNSGVVLALLLCGLVCSLGFSPSRWAGSRGSIINTPRLFAADLKYDAQGYLIKDRDWFNGLSADPGNSLDDPRSVPPVAVAFADKIKRNDKVSFKETMDFLDAHYLYFEVPFKNGDLYSKPKENVASAKIFSFGLMTRMTEAQVLNMFGEISRDLAPNGVDHPNIRQFMKTGWKGILFESGLAISSRLQSGDTTEEVEASQAKALEGGEAWSFDSESFIP
jgi:hypothetical protein